MLIFVSFSLKPLTFYPPYRT